MRRRKSKSMAEAAKSAQTSGDAVGPVTSGSGDQGDLVASLPNVVHMVAAMQVIHAAQHCPASHSRSPRRRQPRARSLRQWYTQDEYTEEAESLFRGAPRSQIDFVSDQSWDFWSDFAKLAERSDIRRGGQELVRMRLVPVKGGRIRNIQVQEVFLPPPSVGVQGGELKLSIF